MLMGRLGGGYGWHQGSPSYSLILDLYLLTLSYASYTREMGLTKNEEARKIHMLTLAFGF